MMTVEQDSPPTPPSPDDREPYAAPRLVAFGSIADITQAIGAKSNMDGGTVTGMKNSQA